MKSLLDPPLRPGPPALLGWTEAELIRGVAERQRIDAALRESESKYAALFNLTPDPMALVRARDGVVLEVNRRCADCFGYRCEEMLGRSTLPGGLGLWIDSSQRREWLAGLERAGELLGYETPMRRRDGSTAIFALSARTIRIGGEECLIWTVRDISAQKVQEEHLKRIARCDALTSLPNRLLLEDRMRQAIAQGQRAGTHLAVCYLDLDGFKQTNDLLGHEAGDEILIEVARRLRAAVRGGDTVARLGGDEFALLLCGLTGDDECLAALERVCATIGEPYRVLDDRRAEVSASIGVTIFPPDDPDPDTLLRHADHAMYVAKRSGRNRYHFFDAPLEQRVEARQATLKRIEAALASDQFVLEYQPRIDCRRGRVAGVEALIRWQHPTLGRLLPAEFLALIEDDRLAVSVGHWVVREALRQAARWRGQGVDLQVSVNACARQLIEPDFAQQLQAMVAAIPGARADRLVIEIVEGAVLKDNKSVRKAIEECRALGVGFALDDFGSGHFSLAHLRHLAAQQIKIDQRLVRDMLVDAGDAAMVQAIIALGRAFGRTVVAEGAETDAHVERLLELGCEFIQGNALAPPMSPEGLMRWMGEFSCTGQMQGEFAPAPS